MTLKCIPLPLVIDSDPRLPICPASQPLVVCGGLQAHVPGHHTFQVPVPVVTGRTDGQAGPVEAPAGETISVGVSGAAGENPVYCKAVLTADVLASRRLTPFRWKSGARSRLPKPNLRLALRFQGFRHVE